MSGIAIDLSGKVVLVTGGTKGLGRGVALRFADAGATVVVAARSVPGHLPDGWGFEQADVRDSDQAFAMVDRVAERHGRLDVVINNAGGAPPADTTTASPRLTERVVALNLLSAIYVSQHSNQHMQSQTDGGVIVNVGSICALRPSPTAAAYGAAKAGLLNYTTTAAQEWAPKVRVNYLTVGLVHTEQADVVYGDAATIKRIEQTIPAGALATPAEIGDVCVFLASPLASYVTGANIVMHGGGDRPAFLGAM
jgi:NAD(P)-dependent dehydrogenase (short-subunit alcohol dehydrogenase family)